MLLVPIHCSYLEFLILHPAQRQDSSVLDRKDGLHHRDDIGEKHLPLLSKPCPLPYSLEGGGESYRVNPGVR